MKELEHLTYEESLRELRLLSIGKTSLSEDLINVYKYLERGCKDRARLFSVVPSHRMRGNGHKLKHRRFPLNIGKQELLFFNCEDN